MSIALTVYLSAQASAILSTANQLYTVSGSPTVQENLVTIGTGTGYSQIYAQGTTNAWAGLSSIGNSDGNGFFLDSSTLLAGQQFLAGNWSASIRSGFKTAGSTGTITYTLRIFQYTSGIYTPIVSLVSAAQSLSGASAITITFPSTAASASPAFESSALLYCDIWANCASNTGSTTAQKLRFGNLSLDSTGQTGAAVESVITPGFQSGSTTNAGDTITRVMLQSLTTGNAATRLLLQVPGTLTKYVAMRLQLLSSVVINGTPAKYLSARLRLALSGDTFVRANQSGLGTASDGETWVTRAGLSTYSLVSNQGQITGDAQNLQVTTLGTSTYQDVETVARFTPSSNLDIFSLVLRCDSAASNLYRARFSGYASPTLDIVKTVAGTNTSMASTAVTVTSKATYWIKFRTVNAGTTVNLFAKIWNSTAAEPSVWTVTYADASTPFGAGFAGLSAAVNVAADTIKFDSYFLIPYRVQSSARDFASRLNLKLAGTPSLQNLSQRLRLMKPADGSMRIRLMKPADIITRIQLMKPADSLIRLLLQGVTSGQTRLRTRIAAIAAGLVLPVRVLLAAHSSQNERWRMRLQSLHLVYAVSRFNLLALHLQDTTLRTILRIINTNQTSLFVRLLMRAVTLPLVQTRLKLMSGMLPFLVLRLVLFGVPLRTMGLRLPLMSRQSHDQSSRARLLVRTTWFLGLRTRLKPSFLSGGASTMRMVLSALLAPRWVQRVRLQAFTGSSLKSRFSLFLLGGQQVACRLRLTQTTSFFQLPSFPPPTYNGPSNTIPFFPVGAPYRLGGTPLDTPQVATTLLPIATTLPADSTLVLLFQSPSPTTQALLVNGALVSLTIPLQVGLPVMVLMALTVQVQGSTWVVRATTQQAMEVEFR